MLSAHRYQRDIIIMQPSLQMHRLRQPVYPTEYSLETDALLMIRPPGGDWDLNVRKAAEGACEVHVDDGLSDGEGELVDWERGVGGACVL